MKMKPENDKWMWLVSRANGKRVEYWTVDDVPAPGWYTLLRLGPSRTPAVLELEDAVRMATDGCVRDLWRYRIEPFDTRENILWREARENPEAD